ncbi:MAG TPA: CHAP domain-containing protein, partial [Acidimicrobiales bacterium]|nr:CHAP domain-containing protein [Acidimicrobiales bacterium]
HSSSSDWADSSFCSSEYDSLYMGVTFNGVAVCGTTSNASGTSNEQGDITYNGVTLDSIGFQCVELASRYLYFTTGDIPPQVNGDDFATAVHEDYKSIPLVPNGTADQPYLPGDIVSFIGNAGTSLAGIGHVAVVTQSTENSSGNGTVTMMEENAADSPQETLSVENWSLLPGAGEFVTPYDFDALASNSPVTTTSASTAPTKVSSGVVYLSMKDPTPVLDPVHVVLDGGDLFVDWLGESSGEIAEYNADTGVEIRVIHGSGDIASSGADIWVLGSTGGTSSLAEINVSTGSVVQVITAPSYKLSGADAVSATSNVVWIANSDNSLTEVSASTGALIRVLSTPSLDLNFPSEIEADGPYVWIPNTRGKSITELNSETGALIRVIRDPSADLGSPEEMTSDVSDMWLITTDGGAIWQVDEFSATTGKLVRVLRDDVEVPEGIADDGAHLWLSNDFSGTVSEYSNATGALIRLIPHNQYQLVPQAIAADANRIWVANAYGENGRYRVYGIPAS